MIFQGYFWPQDPTNLVLTSSFLHPLFMGLGKLGSLNSINNFPPWKQKVDGRNQAEGNLSE